MYNSVCATLSEQPSNDTTKAKTPDNQYITYSLGRKTLHEFTPGFQWGSCYSIFSFMCMFYKLLFVLLSFFVWSLCCLFFFDLRIMITPLISSRSSCCHTVYLRHHYIYNTTYPCRFCIYNNTSHYTNDKHRH